MFLFSSNRHQQNSQQPESQYQRRYCIGQGGFGRVFMAVRLSDQQTVIIKRVPIIKAKKDPMDPTIFREVKYLKKVTELDNVCILLDSYVTRKHLNLVFKNTSTYSTDLVVYREHRKNMTEKRVRCIFLQCVKALLELEFIGILHGDIKPQNILIDWPETKITLIDFGSARQFSNEPCLTFGGTLAFSPPEWLEKKSYQPDKLNVWSMGKLITDFFVIKSNN